MLERRGKAGWAKFHLRPAKYSRAIQMPDFPGCPERAIELGLAEGLEVGRGDRFRRVDLDPDERRGPLLVTDVELRRLILVSKDRIWALDRLDRLTVRAIYYFPRRNSGKYDRERGFRHEFGEGGPRAERDWHLAYPKLCARGKAGFAYELCDGEFTIEPRGIVG